MSFIRRFTTVAVIVLAMMVAPWVISLAAQVINSRSAGFVGVTLRGGTNPFISIPAYLLSRNITTNTTTVLKTSAGVVGCVIINTAGGAGDTITVYGTNNKTSYNKMATIDGTKVGSLFCYGAIGSDGLTVVTATGSPAADVTVTYR